MSDSKALARREKRFGAIVDAQQENPALAVLGDALNLNCWACGDLELDSIQIHHLNPRSRGGTDELTNLALLCVVCHREVPDGYEPADQIAWCVDRESYDARITRLGLAFRDRLRKVEAKLGVKVTRAMLEDVFEAFAESYLCALWPNSKGREEHGWVAIEKYLKGLTPADLEEKERAWAKALAERREAWETHRAERREKEERT